MQLPAHWCFLLRVRALPITGLSCSRSSGQSFSRPMSTAHSTAPAPVWWNKHSPTWCAPPLRSRSTWAASRVPGAFLKLTPQGVPGMGSKGKGGERPATASDLPTSPLPSDAGGRQGEQTRSVIPPDSPVPDRARMLNSCYVLLNLTCDSSSEGQSRAGPEPQGLRSAPSLTCPEGCAARTVPTVPREHRRQPLRHSPGAVSPHLVSAPLLSGSQRSRVCHTCRVPCFTSACADLFGTTVWPGVGSGVKDRLSSPEVLFL